MLTEGVAAGGSSTDPVVKFEHAWIPKNFKLGQDLKKDLVKGAGYVTWLVIYMKTNRS